MSVLVDSAIWSLALRRSAAVDRSIVQELRQLITDRRALLVGPIRQEVLSGIRDPTQFERLRAHLAAFPDVPLVEDDYVLAATYFNACRAIGIQGSNTDFLICAVSVNHQLSVFTTDQDFQHFRVHLPIRLHQEVGR